jgi:small subunit ribosomal protein S8
MSALTDPIADFLTRLRNASVARKHELTMPYSRIKNDVARVLKKEGYITDFSVESEGALQHLKVTTKFVEQTPAISGLQRVSRPGLRRYVGATEIPRVRGGNGIAILSTPRGVLSGREAKRQNVGGELLAYVY